MNGIDVSVVVINYQTYKDTIRCIDSIIAFTKGVTFEVVLVENGTGEFNQENVKGWDNKVKLVISEKNLGFAGGNNLGIAHSSGTYLLLLNSDTYLVEDSISQSINFFKSRGDCGALSARLVYPDGRIQSVAQRFPSIKYQLFELLRLQKLCPKKVAAQFLLGAFFDHSYTVEADWVWGAFFLTRRDIIAQLPQNKLDDEYFMYWEDVQWCKDIKQLGYKVYFYAGTTVVHVQEGSKGKTNDNLLKSEKIFFEKNYSQLHFKLIKYFNNILNTR